MECSEERAANRERLMIILTTGPEDRGNRATLAFAIFYMVINIGSLFGRGFGYFVRDNTAFGTGQSGFERVVAPAEMDNDCAKIGGNWNFRSCVPRE